MPRAWQSLDEDADGRRTGVQRLVGLDAAPALPCPPATVPYGKDLTPDEWTEALRVRAVKEVPASVIRARQDRWDATEWSNIEPWMTLEPAADLECWKPLLQEMGCDKESCDALVGLVKEHGEKGMLECYRIMSHLVKKKDMNNRDEDGHDWSTLLWTAKEEANEALHDSDVGPAYETCPCKKRKTRYDEWDS